jgi:hypothetical protein
MQMKRLSMAALGAAFIALGTFTTAPATAALLEFNFDTEGGGTGSFTLNTEASPNPETVLFRPGLTGITFPNAVSNFSFSAPYINLSSDTTNWSFAPSVTSDVFGLPANLGVLSGVNYPSGCTTPTSFTCTFNVAVLYSGNLSELSDDPLSYRGIGIEVNDPITIDLLLRDDITNFRVVFRKVVPESDSGLSVLAFGIGGAGLLLKRKMNTKKQVAI